jgi:gluconokinase
MERRHLAGNKRATDCGGSHPEEPRVERETTVHKIVVMGVSGSGKSTLAAGIAGALGALPIEGDEHHPSANVEKMRRGDALQDSDREPWLDRLGDLLAAHPAPAVLTCSALKRSYRERLRAKLPGVLFVFVEIDETTAAERVRGRAGHYFPPHLVASQFQALEPPHGEPGVLVVAATLSPQAQLDSVLQWLDAPTDEPGASLPA